MRACFTIVRHLSSTKWRESERISSATCSFGFSASSSTSQATLLSSSAKYASVFGGLWREKCPLKNGANPWALLSRHLSGLTAFLTIHLYVFFTHPNCFPVTEGLSLSYSMLILILSSGLIHNSGFNQHL